LLETNREQCAMSETSRAALPAKFKRLAWSLAA
jgi:hypothetical protein